MPEFRERLRALLNECSRENESDTPDYILAEFLVASLNAFDGAVVHRTNWYLHPATPEASRD